MAQMILTLCRDTNVKVTTILNEISKKEDVTEFITTIQLIQVTINGLLKSKKEFSFELLKDLQNSLKDYETLLAQLNSQPGGLLRFITSNRLRRKIEIANATLHSKLEKFRESIKDKEEQDTPKSNNKGETSTVKEQRELANSTSEDSTTEEEAETTKYRLSLMIEDKDGKDLWAALFGLEVRFVFINSGVDFHG